MSHAITLIRPVKQRNAKRKKVEGELLLMRAFDYIKIDLDLDEFDDDDHNNMYYTHKQGPRWKRRLHNKTHH